MVTKVIFKKWSSNLNYVSFGTASKSLYRFFLYVPYDFDEDLFEKKKKIKMRLITELFADIFMGGSLCLYIMKIAPMPSTWVLS